jgi:hypothetical protein
MIDFTLDRARSSRYEHSACHLSGAGTIAAWVQDFGSVPLHDAYLHRIWDEHSRKTGFGQFVAETPTSAGSQGLHGRCDRKLR